MLPGRVPVRGFSVEEAPACGVNNRTNDTVVSLFWLVFRGMLGQIIFVKRT